MIMWQGAADQLIFWQESIESYREVATLFGGGTTDLLGTAVLVPILPRARRRPLRWRCRSNPVLTVLPDGQSQIFDDLVNWVENGVPPQSAGDSTHLGISVPGREPSARARCAHGRLPRSTAAPAPLSGQQLHLRRKFRCQCRGPVPRSSHCLRRGNLKQSGLRGPRSYGGAVSKTIT